MPQRRHRKRAHADTVPNNRCEGLGHKSLHGSQPIDARGQTGCGMHACIPALQRPRTLVAPTVRASHAVRYRNCQLRSCTHKAVWVIYSNGAGIVHHGASQALCSCYTICMGLLAYQMSLSTSDTNRQHIAARHTLTRRACVLARGNTSVANALLPPVLAGQPTWTLQLTGLFTQSSRPRTMKP